MSIETSCEVVVLSGTLLVTFVFGRWNFIMYITATIRVFPILVLATRIPTFHACYSGSKLCENDSFVIIKE